MIQVERVRLWLLEEIDDISVLMRPLGEPLALGFSRERRFPTTRLREWMGRGGRTGLCVRPCAEDQRSLARAGAHETDGDAPVQLRQDLRRHVAAHQFETFRQDYAVAFNAQAAITNNGCAFTVTASRLLVGLD